MAELLGRAGLMAVGAKAANVAVIVRAAQGERHDMVRHAGLADGTLGSAVPAEGLGPETPKALRYTEPPTQS